MNMLPNEAMEMIAALAPLVKDTENEVVLCVPYTDLFYSLLAVQETNIKIGAQNMHFEEKRSIYWRNFWKDVKINWGTICNNRTL